MIVATIGMKTVVIVVATGTATVVIANIAAATGVTVTGIGTHWRSSASKNSPLL